MNFLALALGVGVGMILVLGMHVISYHIWFKDL